MKQSVNFSAFTSEFHAHNRYEQFGYEALKIIFDYLEEVEESNGDEIELDVIAICCEYNVQGHTGIAQDYSIDLSEAEGDADAEENIVIDYLHENTLVLGHCETGIVYQQF